jgi:16S rRNA (guanine966-N2)-methyltransferase
MLRVSGGTAKGRKLVIPAVPGIRITQEVAREALFAIIGDEIKGSTCLDLYAGSGSVGIEALSRGAIWCDFVDMNNESQKAVTESLKYCGLETYAHFFKDDATKYCANTTRKFNFVFMDPYYDQAIHKHIFKLIPNLLEKDGILFFFHGKELNAKDVTSTSILEVYEERTYGATVISFLKVRKSIL